MLAFMVAFFNQASGINAILYFAPRIFELAGYGENAALLRTVGIGVTNFIFTFAGLYLIDRVGRRTLLFIGSLGYIASLGMCAWTFFSYAPQFEVANSAMSVTKAVERLEKAEAMPVRIEADIASINKDIAKSSAALVAASESQAWDGSKVSFTG